MTSKPEIPFPRPQAAMLADRLIEPRRFMQAVVGPCQVGKTTLMQQVIDTLPLSGTSGQRRRTGPAG